MARQWVGIVTGASSGIGRAVAEAARRQGRQLILVDIDEEGLDAWPEEAGIVHVVGDVRKGDTWDAVAAQAMSRFQGVDAFIHCAGGSGGVVPRPIELVTDSEWDDVISLNLRSAFLGIRAIAPLMKARRHGRVVFVGTVAVRTGTLSGIQAYPAAKSGLSGLARQLAFELGPFGITVNVVAPGLTLSSDRVAAEWDVRPPEEQRAYLQRIPLRRLGDSHDIADAILFVASEQARYITGQTIFVDGGHASI